MKKGPFDGSGVEGALRDSTPAVGVTGAAVRLLAWHSRFRMQARGHLGLPSGAKSERGSKLSSFSRPIGAKHNANRQNSNGCEGGSCTGLEAGRKVHNTSARLPQYAQPTCYSLHKKRNKRLREQENPCKNTPSRLKRALPSDALRLARF